jgi:predicted methyltransferase
MTKQRSPAEVRFLQLATAVVETLHEVGEPVPNGHIYMALQHKGVQLDEHNQLMSTLQRAGLVTIQYDFVRLTERGQATAVAAG